MTEPGRRPQVSVIIPALNAASHIQTQLEALARQDTTLLFEVIVADNGSKDETREIVQNLAPAYPLDMRAVHATKPGASAARNAGAAMAQADVLAFCDSDDRVASTWIEAIHRHVSQGIISAGTSRELRVPFDPTAPVILKAGPVAEGHQLAASGNLALMAQDYWRIGGFDESLPPYGWEDVDFSLRAIEAGLEIRHVPEMTVYYRRSDSLRTRLRKIYLSAWAREMVDARRKTDYSESFGSILRDGATSYRDAMFGPERAPKRKHLILAADLAGRVRGLRSVKRFSRVPTTIERNQHEQVPPATFASNQHLNSADRSTLARIRQTIKEAIGPLLGEGPTLLLDVPNHLNAGDTLIRFGEEALLRHLGVTLALTATKDYQLWRHLASAPLDSMVLLHGGGNLGDLYPAHDLYRRTVLERMPRNRVILMPQSIHYRDASAAQEMRKALERHSNAIVLLRDHVSLDQGRALFPNTDVRFCPDMAFWADLPARHTKSTLSTLRRDDIEGGNINLTQTEEWGFELSDWKLTDSQRHRAIRERRTEHLVNVQIPRRLWYLPCLRDLYGRWNDDSVRTLSTLNRETVDTAFNNSKIVITNRLHAHIICCLKGIPHIAVDNSYGMLSRVYDAYSGEFTSAHFANSAESLRAIFKRLESTRENRAAND